LLVVIDEDVWFVLDGLADWNVPHGEYAKSYQPDVLDSLRTSSHDGGLAPWREIPAAFVFGQRVLKSLTRDVRTRVAGSFHRSRPGVKSVLVTTAYGLSALGNP
jgi:hypothetical protein